MSAATPISTARKPVNYRWLVVVIALAVAVSVLLVFAENRVYQPATPFAGGTGDHVHAFALDPLHANHVYAGTHYGFFRSTDGGGSWTRLNGNSGLATTIVATAITISPLDSRTVYVAGYRLDNGNAVGLAVTHDDGAHWRTLPTGGAGQLPDPRVLFVTAGWAQPGEAYAYSIEAGLFRTLDAGTHWVLIASPFAGQVTAFVPVLDCSDIGKSAVVGTDCPERLLVGTTQGLLVGMDATAAQASFAPVTGVSAYVYSVTAHRGVHATVYASTQQGVFAASSPTAPMQPVTSVAGGSATFTSLAVSGGDAALVYGVTAQNIVETSRDGGHSWQATGSSLLTRGLSQLNSGLRTATGSNTPQWAGGQNVFLTLLQTPVDATSRVYAAISFPVQVFTSANGGDSWNDLSQGN